MTTKMTYKNRKRFDENPFLKNLNVPKRFKTKNDDKQKPELIFNTDGGITGQKAVQRIIEFNDTEQFIKVYTKRIGLWMELSAKARKILDYIMLHIEQNKDQVTLDLDHDDIKIQIGYSSKASIYGGLDELIQREIIAKARWKDVFYINPGIMFNGNRAFFIEEFRRVNVKPTNTVIDGVGGSDELHKQLSEFQDHIDDTD